jgi:glycosyltransferase involved in cell wall biosynthesis
MPAKSITFLSQVFHPDDQATSQLFTDLISRLAKKGLVIRAVAGFTKGENGHSPSRRELYQGVEIRRAGISLDYKRGFILRALHYLCFMAGGTVEVWRLRKNTLVVGVTNPPITPVWLWLLSKCFVKRYALILLDVYPDGLVALGIMRGKSLPVRLWRWANTKAFQKAKHIVVLGRDMAELIHRRYGVPMERIIYVPHWSSFVSDGVRSAEDTGLYQKLGLHGKFVVQYSGNMGLWHDMETIVRAAELLKMHRNLHFLMIGGGMRKKKAIEVSEYLKLTNITWLPFQPKESLVDSLSCCHVALISQREGLQGVAVPCKLYGILASGRPIVATVPKDSEIDRVIAEENCGVALHGATSRDLANAILELSGNSGRLKIMGDNAYAAYKAKYSIERAVLRFGELWNDGKGHLVEEGRQAP